MKWIDNIADLEGLYGQAGDAATRKVASSLTPLYRKWIMSSRLCVLSTIGPDGTDGSPRGDDGPAVLELDEHTLAMPDWRGNNRLDSLRNIVSDGRVSLMFVVPGSNNVVRVNGKAQLTQDVVLRDRFERKGRVPVTVIVIKIAEIYSQCARALMRAQTWSRNDAEGLPSIGDILAEMTDGEVGGLAYDTEWGGRASKTMW
ncbi:MAG: PPOX class probable FMN-dependent enzyme [Ascidiaceihabitans sp.]|mgnify:CR=1 FL=1|jgi:PPOX class probable FMN-dependent enzyme|tara:strand:- start:1257 stop:1859 length:603 start_codon:yes stop_codon:yes gene_type:complete